MPNPKLVPNVTFSQNCLFVENFKCKVTCFFLYKVHEFLHLMTSSLPLQRDQSASYERNCVRATSATQPCMVWCVKPSYLFMIAKHGFVFLRRGKRLFNFLCFSHKPIMCINFHRVVLKEKQDLECCSFKPGVSKIYKFLISRSHKLLHKTVRGPDILLNVIASGYVTFSQINKFFVNVLFFHYIRNDFAGLSLVSRDLKCGMRNHTRITHCCAGQFLSFRKNNCFRHQQRWNKCL